MKIIIVWNKVFLVLMEQQNSQFKSYFLGTLDAEEVDGVELQILEEKEFAEMLELAENDLIEEYLDGGLSINDQKAFEQNYLISVSRRKKVEFLKAIKTFAKHQSKIINAPKPSFFETLKLKFSLRPPLLAFGTIALICAVGITSFFVWKNSTNKSEVLISLNKVYKNERPLDSRISDFDYAPKVEGTRGAKDKENEEFILTKSVASGEVLKNPTAESFHALGQVYLTEKDFDKAIEQFEKAIKLNPNISKLHNDLGVALLEKGKLAKTKCVEKTKQKQECDDEKEPYLLSLAQANEEFAKAIELDKTLLEANFNQALCIQAHEVLPNQAKEAWENYLKLDSTSKWADEARKNLETIETQKPVSKNKDEILRDFLAAKDAGDDDKAWEIISRNRDLGSSKLIPQQLAFLFVDSKVTGNETEAKKAIDALVYAGKLEEKKGGDLFWNQLANYYYQIKNEHISSTQEAQKLMIESANLRLQGHTNKSLDGFIKAKNIFKSNGNLVEEKLCENWIASASFHLDKLEESNKFFTDFVEYSENNKFKWLATQSYARLQIGFNSQNKHSASIENSYKALKIAYETNDIFNIKRSLYNLADNYRSLGQYKKAFNVEEKELSFIDSNQSSVERIGTLETITSLLNELRLYRTAILYQKEAINVAKDANNIIDEQLSLMYLGTLFTNLKKYDEAKTYFKESIEKANSFESEEVKSKALAYTNLRYANLQRILGYSDESAKLFESSTNFYSSSEFKLHNYESNKGKLLSNLQSGNDAEIQKELPVIFDIFTKYRKEIVEEQNRNSFFDNEQDVYDIATEYEFGKSDFATAFDYAEESRSRSLLDLQNSVSQVSTNEKQPEIKFSANLSEPLKLTQIQAEMPENTELLVYSVLPEKVLIWTITKDSLNATKYEISIENLQEKVTNYLQSVSKNQELDEQVKLSKELFQILISPIKEKLDTQKQIIIVPDKILFRLPFATLYSDKYFLEDYKISYSPSANIFLNCTKKAKDLDEKKAETLLSIGNPQFNQNEYENSLQTLPSAKDEATEIAKLYVNPKVLVESEATKESVKENIKNADVFHFAGHYLAEEKTPLLSSFVLAGEKISNLANYEIISEKLSHTRLIVLSACDTEIETYYNGEGMIGASRTFLAINVPLVVASQWSVDSEATKDLMIRFHQLRKTENLSTAEALRISQLEMLKNEKFKEPYYWAAFNSIGGYTQF